MKRLDRLVLGEMFGPWVFGVAIFTVIIMAGQFLFILTNYLVSGVSPTQLATYTGLLLPGIMVKTFAMAVLLSALLSFGRLSSDSEIVALKAAGAGVIRIMVPVAAFGVIVAVLYFVTDELVVAPAARQAEVIKNAIQKKLTGQGNRIEFAITDPDGAQRAGLMAKDFDVGAGTLTDVLIEFYDKHNRPSAIVWAPKMTFKGKDLGSIKSSAATHWRLSPGGKVFPMDQSSAWNLGQTYPVELGPEPPDPSDILASSLKNLDALDMPQTLTAIQKLAQNPKADPGNIANLWYGYYNKISLPLATVVFALVGAPLGIRSHRTSTASGFALSIVIIFAYMMLSNWMAIISTGQRIPPYAASFAPIVVGLACAVVLIYRRNRS